MGCGSSRSNAQDNMAVSSPQKVKNNPNSNSDPRKKYPAPIKHTDDVNGLGEYYVINKGNKKEYVIKVEDNMHQSSIMMRRNSRKGI